MLNKEMSFNAYIMWLLDIGHVYYNLIRASIPQASFKSAGQQTKGPGGCSGYSDDFILVILRGPWTDNERHLTH